MNPVIRLIGLLAILTMAAPVAADEPKASSLAELLNQVRAGWKAESVENQKRMAEFNSAKDQQAALLKKAQTQLASEQARGDALEKAFDKHEAEIAQLQETLRLRLGTMGELFGVIRQMAGDARSHIEASLTSAQFPDRAAQIDPLARSKGLPSVEQLENLWFLLHQEMIESGKVARFPAEVITTTGEQKKMNVIRVGVFNAVADGKYLNWDIKSAQPKLVELQRQPASRYMEGVAGLASAKDGPVRFAVDPARGSLLSILVDTPSFEERIHFGGVIGYITIALGVVTALLGLIRLLYLAMVGFLVRRQRKTDKPSKRNPLGRVLLVHAENPNLDVETLERKLDEAILRESARMDRYLWAIKIISVVAPLLGLLGTVTGMIQTFQTITMFGTGDPKLMAGGISEALVTTMLGLMVAIPLVLLHSLLQSMSRRVSEVIEEQSAGIIARCAEAQKE